MADVSAPRTVRAPRGLELSCKSWQTEAALRMLMNILRPDRGEITLLGKPTSRMSPRDFERIGYVSESQKLPGALTLAQFFDYLRALYPTWDRVLERELCEQFEELLEDEQALKRFELPRRPLCPRPPGPRGQRRLWP